jgi:hypothetical protein
MSDSVEPSDRFVIAITSQSAESRGLYDHFHLTAASCIVSAPADDGAHARQDAHAMQEVHAIHQAPAMQEADSMVKGHAPGKQCTT